MPQDPFYALRRRQVLAGLAACPLAALPSGGVMAQAAAPAASLLADLLRLPEAAFLPAGPGVDPWEIAWGDPETCGALGLAADGPFAPWSRFQTGFALDYLAGGFDGGWARTVGFTAADLRRFVTVAALPVTGAVLELVPAAAEKVGPALAARGFAESTVQGVTAWARGADNAISLVLRDPADPFGGSTGKSARVLLEGDRLVQASEWPLLASLAGVSGPLGHTDLPALAAALDNAGFAGALPVQAIVLTDQAALSGGPPGAGILPWRLGLFVDLSDGKTDHAAAVFSYPTRAQAEASARRLTEAWPKGQSRMMNSAFETRLPLKAIRVTGDMPAVLTFHAHGENGGDPGFGNPGYRFLLQARQARDLAPFGL